MLLGCSLVSCAKDENLKKVNIVDEETNYVVIQVKEHGSIVVELFPDVAPITVENFKKLVSEDFYDGLTFHRVIKNFMIQGGDPKGNGTGGSDEEIVGEFSANGIENNLKHTRGVLSMARSNDPNSASSQFFICHADSAHLNGNYAAFGKVVYGLEVVDSIAAVRTNSSDKPLTNVVIKSIDFVTLKEAK
jgi:peptidyl-prolyl cis-trans isomerase B (cyclophilin B)